MSDNDPIALLAEALEFLNDHPSFSLRRDRRRTSYELASRIDAYFRGTHQNVTPAELYRQALELLPATTRDVLLAHQREGLSYADIAERLGITTLEIEHHIAEALFTLGAAIDPLDQSFFPDEGESRP